MERNFLNKLLAASALPERRSDYDVVVASFSDAIQMAAGVLEWGFFGRYRTAPATFDQATATPGGLLDLLGFGMHRLLGAEREMGPLTIVRFCTVADEGFARCARFAGPG